MKRIAGIVVALCIAASASAQSPLDTKTIELKHLKPTEAVKLLKPYIVSTGGGVFDVSETIPIITIRDVPENIAKMEKVLAKYDHTPATVRLVFQLIEADTGTRLVNASNTRPQVPVDLDSTLRSVLRFPVYRLLAQGLATSGEFSTVRQQMGDAGQGLTYALGAYVGAIKIRDGNSMSVDVGTLGPDTTVTGTVSLEVSLGREGMQQTSPGGNAAGRPDKISETVLSTRLDVPLGHTVVLGTAAPRLNGKALILTVKPELVRVK